MGGYWGRNGHYQHLRELEGRGGGVGEVNYMNECTCYLYLKVSLASFLPAEEIHCLQ